MTESTKCTVLFFIFQNSALQIYSPWYQLILFLPSPLGRQGHFQSSICEQIFKEIRLAHQLGTFIQGPAFILKQTRMSVNLRIIGTASVFYILW